MKAKMLPLEQQFRANVFYLPTTKITTKALLFSENDGNKSRAGRLWKALICECRREVRK